jgi:hypothetical protein
MGFSLFLQHFDGKPFGQIQSVFSQFESGDGMSEGDGIPVGKSPDVYYL